jgi:periplasmic protein TonB
MSVKESVAVGDTRSGAPRPGQRGEAVGAEIPVTVHASRTTQGLGKNLPPVHEETRTVIVLQQGAVVRLTALLNVGETAVLTNRMNGADVLCRVSNVKSQPGIQHYVDLEFIQRAPNFWGDTLAGQSVLASDAVPAPGLLESATQRGVIAPAPSVPQPPAAVVQMPAPAQEALRASPQPSSELNSRSAASVPSSVSGVAQPPAPIASAGPTLVISSTKPVVSSSPVGLRPPSEMLPTPLAEPVSSPFNAHLNAVTTGRPAIGSPFDSTSPLDSIGAVGGTTSTGARKALVAAAAVFLVTAGAFGGYWFTQHKGTAPRAAAPTPVASVPQNNATEPPAAAEPSNAGPVIIQPDAPQLNLSSPQPEPETEVSVEPERPPKAPEVHADVRPVRVQPPAPPATPPREVASTVHRAKVPFGQLKAPQLKDAPLRTDSAAPPPVIGVSSNLNASAANTLLPVAAPAPPPVGSGAAIGGRLEQPQLISSAAATYPAAARAQHLQGVVVLDAFVDETGKVSQTALVSGPPLLVAAAQNAVRYWRYEPAHLDGKPISIHIKVNVRFTLN